MLFFWTLYSKILEGGKRYHFFVINIKQHNIFNIDNIKKYFLISKLVY